MSQEETKKAAVPGDEADNEDDESSYYDEEEESEEEDATGAKAKEEPKTQEIVNIRGEVDEKMAQEISAQKIFAKNLEEKNAAKLDDSELFKKMREEWESLQKGQSSIDDQIKMQLDMLDQINKKAFDAGLSGGKIPSEQMESGEPKTMEVGAASGAKTESNKEPTISVVI